jgi:hypothetical protein
MEIDQKLRLVLETIVKTRHDSGDGIWLEPTESDCEPM